jgi:guanylate kinase
MAHWSEFDYVVVNDEFGRAVEELNAIVAGRGEASKSSAPGIASFATRLTGDHTTRE